MNCAEPDSNSWTPKVKLHNAVSLACDQQYAKLPRNERTQTILFYNFIINYIILDAFNCTLWAQRKFQFTRNQQKNRVSFVKAPPSHNNIIINGMKWWLTHALWLWLYHRKDVVLRAQFSMAAFGLCLSVLNILPQFGFKCIKIKLTVLTDCNFIVFEIQTMDWCEVVFDRSYWHVKWWNCHLCGMIGWKIVDFAF